MTYSPRDEVEQAFINYWVTGCIQEDWEAWVDLFVDDVHGGEVRTRAQAIR